MGFEKEFVISRIFDAPKDLIYRTWIEPDHFSRWFGPEGCHVKIIQFDVRPGGVAHTCLTMSDGNSIWGKLVYREVIWPEKLVYVTAFSDEKGGLTRHPMSVTWPREMLTTVLFEDQQGKTKLTVKWIPENASPEEWETFLAAMESMTGGWIGTFEKLKSYLEGIKGGSHE